MSVSADARATRNVPFSARLQGILGAMAGPVEEGAAERGTAMRGVVHASRAGDGGKEAACKLTATFTLLHARRQGAEYLHANGARQRRVSPQRSSGVVRLKRKRYRATRRCSRAPLVLSLPEAPKKHRPNDAKA